MKEVEDSTKTQRPLYFFRISLYWDDADTFSKALEIRSYSSSDVLGLVAIYASVGTAVIWNAGSRESRGRFIDFN